MIQAKRYVEKVARIMQRTVGEKNHDEENLTASKSSEELLLSRGMAVDWRFYK